MKIPLLSLLAVLLIPLASPAAEDKKPEGPPMDRLSFTETEKLFRGMGVVFEEIEHGAFSVELEGYRVVFYNRFDTIQIYAGFSGYEQLKPQAVNRWNREKRFSKAYMDASGDPCLECDLLLRGGVTTENIKQFLNTFKLSLKAFSDFLDNEN